MPETRAELATIGRVAPVGDGITTAGRWSFAGAVAEHFDTHVIRSVPSYEAGHQAVVELAAHFIQPAGMVYDIGCSTGTLLAALDDQYRNRGAHLVGLDVETDMVRQARARFEGRTDIEIVRADARGYRWRPADLIVAHYTVQFVPVGDRARLIADLYRALRPGGALLWFEKTLAPTPRLQDVVAQAYAEHKLAAGYSAEQAAAKARAIRGVLVPQTSRENRQLLARAGFTEVMTVHQQLSFEGVLAIKGDAG
ncbi:methyltransferase domain-containing protein [Streptomyces sp. NPDC048445]|uniref:methyltransferase domain-containing protein n=1 Tax=Streptomyces sp. NPDC048445 TaxID=3365553 RepID=UPI0037230A6B